MNKKKVDRKEDNSKEMRLFLRELENRFSREKTFKEKLKDFFQTAVGLLFFIAIILGVFILVLFVLVGIFEIIQNTEVFLSVVLAAIAIKYVWSSRGI